jgi:hypothetical protein
MQCGEFEDYRAKVAEKAAYDAQFTKGYETSKTRKRLSPRDQAILARGGTLSD